MNTRDPFIAVEEELRIDGIKVLRGNGTLGVIYNNLAGLNIQDRFEYDQYLAFMAAHLCLEPITCSTSMSFLANQAEVASCRVGDPMATRVTKELVLDTLKGQYVDLLLEEESIEMASSQGRDEPTHAERLKQIDDLMASSPYCAHPDHGVVLKTEH